MVYDDRIIFRMVVDDGKNLLKVMSTFCIAKNVKHFLSPKFLHKICTVEPKITVNPFLTVFPPKSVYGLCSGVSNSL